MAQRDVELLIKVRDEARATVKKTTEAIEDFTRQIKGAKGEAGKADSTLASLASEYDKLKNVLVELRSAVGAAEVFNKTAEAAQKAAQKLADTRAELAQQQAALGKTATKLRETTQAYEQNSARLAEMQAQLAELRQTQAQLEASQELLQRYERERSTLAKLRQEYVEVNDALRRTFAERNATEQRIAALNATLEANRARLKELRDEYKALQAASERVSGIRSQIKAYQDLQTALSKYQDRLAKQTARQAQLTAQIEKAETPSKTLTKNFEANARAIGNTQARIGEVTTKLAELSATLKGYGVDVADLAGSNEELAAQFSTVSKRAEAVAAEIAQLKAANKDAEKAVQEHARAHKEVEKSINSGRKAAEKVKTSLREVEQSVGATGAKLREYGFTLVDIEADERKRQARVLSTSRAIDAQAAAVEAAKAANQQLGQTLREVTGEYARTEAAVERLAGAVRNAKVAAAEQQAALQQARAAAKQAGVDTNNVAAAQQRLQAEAKQTAQAIDQAGREIKEFKSELKDASREAKRTANTLDLLNDNSRQAMSFYQRLRGEVIALTMAYIGLYGAIAQVQAASVRTMEREATQARFAQIFKGDAEASAAELAFIEAAANRLGLRLSTLEKQYSKFAVASRLAGASSNETRTIFEATAEAAAVMRLSNEELEGALHAIEQIMSKGKIQAEELRGQLGDRFPGAVSIMARALGKSTAELDKMMEQGTLTRDMLLNFAVQLKKDFGPALSEATKGFRAELNRLLNEVEKLQLAFGEDFHRNMTEPMRRIREALASDDVRAAVKDLAHWFGVAGNVAATLVENLDEVVLVLKLLLSVQATKFFYGMAASMLEAATAARAATGAVAGLQKAFAGFFAFLVGWNIGSYLHDQFVEVRRFGVALVTGFASLGANIEYGWRAIWPAVRRAFLEFKDGILKDLSELANGTRERVANILEGLGFSDAAAKVRSGITQYRAQFTGEIKKLNEELEALAKERNKKLADIRDIGFGMWQDAANPTTAGKAGGFDANAERAKREEWARIEAEKRLRLAAEGQANAEILKLRKSLENDLERIRVKLAEREARTLQQRLDAIRVKYEKLIADLQKVGNKEGVELVNRLISVEQQDERENYELEQRKKLADELRQKEEAVNDAIRYRAALLENIRIRQETGEISAREARLELKAVDEQHMPIIEKLAQDAMAFAAAMGRQDIAANMEALLLKLKPVKAELFTVNQFVDRLASGGASVFDSFSKGLYDAAAGAASLGEGLKGVWNTFRQFASDFLRQIAQMIMKQAILNALQSSSSGGWVGAVVGALNATVNHSGAVVGSSSSRNRARRVDPAWFAAAQRFHTGGLPGLKANEVPAILERGEEVLSKNDPRNILNGGGSAGMSAAGQRPQDIKVINYVDSESVVSEGLNTPSGVKAIINVIRANKSTFKSVLS